MMLDIWRGSVDRGNGIGEVMTLEYKGEGVETSKVRNKVKKLIAFLHVFCNTFISKEISSLQPKMLFLHSTSGVKPLSNDPTFHPTFLPTFHPTFVQHFIQHSLNILVQ